MAFSTCSSLTTLPVSMHCIQKNLGVSKSVTSFVLPLGTTLNMNGAALYQVMAAMFVAQAYGIELSVPTTLLLIATSTISAVAAAGSARIRIFNAFISIWGYRFAFRRDGFISRN